MSQNSSSPFPLRDAALRMIAAAEHYKSTGHLPQWARDELDAWSDAPAVQVSPSASAR